MLQTQPSVSGLIYISLIRFLFFMGYYLWLWFRIWMFSNTLCVESLVSVPAMLRRGAFGKWLTQEGCCLMNEKLKEVTEIRPNDRK